MYLNRAPYDELKRKFAATDGKPYLERLRLMLREWFPIMEKYNLHFTMLYIRSLPNQGPALTRTSKQSQIDQGLSMLRYCLRMAVEHGELCADTPVDDPGMALAFSIQGAAVYQAQNPDSFDVSSWADAGAIRQSWRGNAPTFRV